jgi:hypothetical protein
MYVAGFQECIKWQSSQPINSGWVSVEDRLPENEDYYAVRFENGVEDEKPFRIRQEKNILGFMTTEKVTHWQNLPSPPKQ